MNDKNMKSLSVKKVFMFMLVMSLIVTQALFWGANAASKKTPARVTISSVKAGGTNKVTVKWKKTKNANKYRVYYRKSGSKKWIKVVDTKKLSYTQKSSKARPLKANTKYQYVIKAYNTKSKKWGKLSKVKTIKTAKAAAKKTATPTSKPKATATSKPQATATEKAKPQATSTIQPTATNSPTVTSQPTATATPTAIPTPTNSPTPTPTTYIKQYDYVNGGPTVVQQTINSSIAPGESFRGVVKKIDYNIDVNISDIKFSILSGKDLLYEYYVDTKYQPNMAEVGFKAGVKQGQITIIAEYGGYELRRWNIIVTGDYAPYTQYESWRKSVIQETCTSGMSLYDKLDAIKTYIWKNFTLAQTGQDDYFVSWMNGNRKIDCYGATRLMGDFAEDLNCDIVYCYANGEYYRYRTNAFSSGHVYPVVYVNAQWIGFDAQPTSGNYPIDYSTHTVDTNNLLDYTY